MLSVISGASRRSSVCFQRRKNCVIASRSGALCVRKTTESSPSGPSVVRKSCTSYLTVGRYLYSRLDFSDMVSALGEKKGTSSRLGASICSTARKMSLIRRSGVVTET